MQSHIDNHFSYQINPTRMAAITSYFEKELNWLINHAWPKAHANNKLGRLLIVALNLRDLAYRYQLDITNALEHPENDPIWKRLDNIISKLTELTDGLFVNQGRQQDAQNRLKRMRKLPAFSKEVRMEDMKSHLLKRADHYTKLAKVCMNKMQKKPTFFSARTSYVNQALKAAEENYLRLDNREGLYEVDDERDSLESITTGAMTRKRLKSSTNATSSSASTSDMQDQEEKIPTTTYIADTHQEINRFVELDRLPVDPNKVIRKILILDIDDTLAKQLVFSPHVRFINKNELVQTLKDLPDDVAVFVVTSRIYPDINHPDVTQIIDTLEDKDHVGRKFVHSAIYTSGCDKNNVMNDLYRRYLAFEPAGTKKDVGILDDNFEHNIQFAEFGGFTGIHVQKDGLGHFQKVREFVAAPVLSADNEIKEESQSDFRPR